MARGARYKVPFRRRREGLTDYRARLKMIISRKPRLVVRKTNMYVIAQIAEAKINGDEIIVSAHSKELRKYGWKYSCKNTPACYLLGLLVGYRAVKSGVKEAILDIGLHRPTKGARVFAVAKGALDAGLNIPISEEKIPSEERIRGEHIKEYAEKLLSENQEEYNRRFSNYMKMKVKPEDITEEFEKVKKKIIMEYGG
ncbi:MAG: 50S ribosomal protein L18 [archaeon YNP-LCB-003-016]|jgi:large subunit ribosomal protein L18|uniref:50S ribosomal protein L18 n=1 Tax=Candidatus Culexarchaeum yellowstonense TaxID=2928963 RepID=UPI0026ED4251|nr:50S ribosomal protein L18 [Candidatus Culexarchaeum yellowstonense]MCR6668404.1 50S ribosomal protein L18 [Candidatus Culexarchaeum yellowstonense]MCR6691252.1 50S ribosomal protein L18 [Candidatus Culexarchaeum yellowstonense]